jgi:hypothetical protein
VWTPSAQILNGNSHQALKDFIALERQVRETDELATEIEELKREYGVA